MQRYDNKNHARIQQDDEYVWPLAAVVWLAVICACIAQYWGGY